MKNFGNLIAAAGIVLFIYALAGRFIGKPTLGMNFIEVRATAGLVAANSVMLIGIIINLWDKQ